MKSEIRSWAHKGGVKLLRTVGLKKAQVVVDFGCGNGNYTVSASRVVGRKGKVYAIDKNKDVLDELKKRLKEEEIPNVELINEKTKIPLDENSVDVVLCYDVIHLVGKNDSSIEKDRKDLYGSIMRIIKRNALVSFYPTHLDTHTEVTSKEAIRKEIEQTGFKFEKEIYTELIHDDNKVKGYIVNFRRR